MKITGTTQPPKGNRTLKVYAFWRKKRYDYEIVPEIFPCGKWLQKMGFECGEKVRVFETENRIVITKVANKIITL
jgi:toxic protein SymE